MERQPTLVVGELAFILLASVALKHAIANGREHLLLWLAALIGGIFNDVFFMVLPFVDNFWHAQCLFMLGPRLPLYILGVYIAFIYVPVAASWRLPVPPLARFAASGLTAGLLYAPFDCTGAKFLWWTWHDTSADVQVRWLGVPIGSTMFTIMQTFGVHWLLHVAALRRDGKAAKAPLSPARFAASLILVAVLGTPLMMISMTPFQMLQLKLDADGNPITLPGRPDPPAMILQCGCLLNIGLLSAWAGARRKAKASPPTFLPKVPQHDTLLFQAAVAYFSSLALVMALGDPAAVVAEGVHQQYGACHVPDVDLSNYSRYKYLCKSDYDEDFTFLCPAAAAQPLPPPQPSWYILCGKAHSSYSLHFLAVTGLGAAASACIYGMLFAHRHRTASPGTGSANGPRVTTRSSKKAQ